jgi:hypothetical protein
MKGLGCDPPHADAPSASSATTAARVLIET